jgi:C1A family cysteine protease
MKKLLIKLLTWLTKEKETVNGWYGWTGKIPDNRDLIYPTVDPSTISLPSKVDLSPNFQAAFDQGNLGSCVLNALAGIIQYLLWLEKLPIFMPSRLFMYYNVRKLEGDVNTDGGCQCRDAIKVYNSQGVCDENMWKYIISRFKKKPSKDCYTSALNDKGLKYQSVPQDLNTMRKILASGYPILVGISVYTYFESPEMAKTGIGRIPTPDEQQLGGHGIVLVGYNDIDKTWKLRNSWGDWGMDHGYFTLPYEYLTNKNLSDDFWVVSLVGK